MQTRLQPCLGARVAARIDLRIHDVSFCNSQDILEAGFLIFIEVAHDRVAFSALRDPKRLVDGFERVLHFVPSFLAVKFRLLKFTVIDVQYVGRDCLAFLETANDFQTVDLGLFFGLRLVRYAVFWETVGELPQVFNYVQSGDLQGPFHIVKPILLLEKSHRVAVLVVRHSGKILHRCVHWLSMVNALILWDYIGV